jgi:hypothetical protein
LLAEEVPPGAFFGEEEVTAQEIGDGVWGALVVAVEGFIFGVDTKRTFFVDVCVPACY